MSNNGTRKYIGVLGSNSGKSHNHAMRGIVRFAKRHGLTVVDFSELGILCEQPTASAWTLSGIISFGQPAQHSMPSVCLLPDDGAKAGVSTDLFSVAEAAFTHLRSLNPASISLLRDPGSPSPLLDGWKEASREYSCHRGEFALRSDSPSLGASSLAEKERFEQWLADLPRPAAICCTTDILAIAAMSTCDRLGFTIPEDAAVLTCGNSRLAEQFDCGITGVSGAFEQAGYEAAQVLQHLTSDPTAAQRSVIVSGTELTKRGSTDRLATLPTDIRIAQEFIHREACNGINVKDVMATQEVSRVTFERRFKEYTGQTPGAEIRRVRAENAESLLKTTDMPMAEVASRCGFEGSSRFSLFFRKRTGVSPSEYRTRFRS